MVTRSVIRITAAEATAIKASPARTVEGSGRDTFANNNELGSSRHADALPGCDLMQSKSTESNTDSLKEVAPKKDYDPTEGPSKSSNKSMKRRRSNSVAIDLSDVPPQSPIPKDNRDGRTKDGASKYCGVSWNKKNKKWIAMIYLEGKARHIGYYDNEEEAGIDYARAVYKYKGEESLEKATKRQRSSSLTIDFSDVPPQSPIPKDKSDGRMKNCTSKYVGVSWDKQMNKWSAKISIEGKSRRIGFYVNEEEAGIDYARAAYKYRRKEASKKSKKRPRSNSLTIDLSDVPTQSPIPKIKTDKDGTSKYIGVSWDKQMNKWSSCISIEGKNRRIGCYENEEEAGIDYARAVYKYKGGEKALEKSKNFNIDLSDVPPQSPITTDKSDGGMKNGTSKYTGIFWNKQMNKWGAKITIEGKQRYFGYYTNEEEAGIDYARAVYKYKGKEALDKARVQASQIKLELSDVPSISPIIKSGKRGTEASSRYVGVSFDKGNKKWVSRIQVGGKQIHIGFYESEEQAAVDYARALLKFRGQEALDKAREQAAQCKFDKTH